MGTRVYPGSIVLICRYAKATRLLRCTAVSIPNYVLVILRWVCYWGAAIYTWCTGSIFYWTAIKKRNITVTNGGIIWIYKICRHDLDTPRTYKVSVHWWQRKKTGWNGRWRYIICIYIYLRTHYVRVPADLAGDTNRWLIVPNYEVLCTLYTHFLRFTFLFFCSSQPTPGGKTSKVCLAGSCTLEYTPAGNLPGYIIPYRWYHLLYSPFSSFVSLPP